MAESESITAEVAGIARHAKSRAPMEPLSSAVITMEAGVEGDFRGTPGPRQVTVVSLDAWQTATAELAAELPWTMRRANLLLRGIVLRDTVGRRLRIGDVVLEITEQNEPCFVMDRQHRGLRRALEADWRAGVACRVLHGGAVKIGDRAVLV